MGKSYSKFRAIEVFVGTHSCQFWQQSRGRHVGPLRTFKTRGACGVEQSIDLFYSSRWNLDTIEGSVLDQQSTHRRGIFKRRPPDPAQEFKRESIAVRSIVRFVNE